MRICGEWLLYISNNFGGHLKCEGQKWSTFLTYGSANHFRLISNFIFYFSRKRTAIMEHLFGCYQNILERSVRSVVLEISSLWICLNEIKKVKPGIDLLEFLGLALLSILCSSLFSLSAIVDEYSRFSGHVNSRLKRSLPIFFYFFFQKRCLPIEMGNIISPFTKMMEKARYNVHGFPFVLLIST